MAELGDAGREFLLNEIPKGKRVYLGRKRYRSDYCNRILKSLTTTGHIERINKNGVPTLRITPTAKNKLLKNDIPLPYLQKQKWQGYFHGLAYDFPEKKRYQRQQLRNLIKTWGLGQFQLSFWITPHPLEEVIDEFIINNKLEKFAFRFNTKKLTISQGQSIAKRVWNLLEIKKAQRQFTNKWYRKQKEKKLALKNKSLIEQEYFNLLEKDPHLPSDLLPADWLADEAKDIFLEVKEKLAKL